MPEDFNVHPLYLYLFLMKSDLGCKIQQPVMKEGCGQPPS